MGWAQVIQLIIGEGIPAAYKIWQLATKGSDPTQSDWDVLLSMTERTPAMQLTSALNRAGIPLDDPRAVALLGMIK